MTFQWVDRLSEALSDEYEAERERLVRSGEAQRARAVAALLGGEPVDPSALSRVLRYELGRTHLGLVLWIDADARTRDAPQRLERAAHEIARSLGAHGALTLSSSPMVTWAWIGAAQPSTPPRSPGPAAMASRSRSELQPMVRADFAPRTRMRSTPSSWPRSGRRPGTVVQYASVELAAMLVGDLPRARRFVERHLGVLARDDEDMARLRATLRVYLDERGSRAGDRRPARRPREHRREPRRACEDLLGRPIAGGLLELHAALAIAQALGRPCCAPRPAAA